MEPLVTAEQLAQYSKGSISAFDPRVDDAIKGASQAVRNYCGWHVTPVLEETVIADGPGGRLLSLPTKQLVSAPSIIEDETTLLDNTDYRWSQDGSVKRKSSYWPDDFRILTVTMNHGYAEADDLKRVVLAVITRELSSPTGATREQAGAVSVSWALTAPGVSGGIALLQNEQATLDFYRIESI